MATTSEIWKFADAAERDARVGFGSGVVDLDLCVLPDGNLHRYDALAELWFGVAGGTLRVATTDATPLVTVVSTLADNFHTKQLEVWIQSVRDTGVNWRFRRVALTAHRTGGIVTLSAPVDIVPVTSAGTGSTLAYAFSVSGDQIRVDITGNAAENWDHTIRTEAAEAGA